METMTIFWLILGFISILALIYDFSTSQNKTFIYPILGFAIGLILVLKNYYEGREIDWYILPKSAVLTTLAGIIIVFFKRK